MFLAEEKPVSYHFVWWIILLSFFVSLIGSWTTVEFLHRRRLGQGWVSQLHLAACAMKFGLVAIWCMHFVGNRSIVLSNGETQYQLYYNAGYTTLSAALPILFLYFGFFLVDRYSKSQQAMYLSLVVTGITAGLSITGMHYIGNLGVSNYHLQHKPSHIVGAALIAVFACWFSFTIFFRQQELWINSWYRRFMCAVLLACTVSGMHWTATAGTSYYRIHTYPGTEEQRNRNVIVATALCMTALLCSIFLLFLTEQRRRELADRAQHVVLASLVVDRDGRVLVTQEGLLPCQKITKQYNQQSFNDEFNVAHPVFQWIYRVSHHWPGVSGLVFSMKSHLRATGALHTASRPGTSKTTSTTWEGPISEEDYSAVFREQFCVAAQELADHLRMPLEKLGVLFDDIMMTGVDNKKAKPTSSDAASAMETGTSSQALFGKGQVLFVVNSVSKSQTLRLSEQGYRFAQIERVSDKVLEIMARSMQVKKEHLLSMILRMKRVGAREADFDSPFDSGTHISCFVLRPPLKSSTTGWEVLVSRDRPDEIPSLELTEDSLQPSELRILQKLDGYTYAQCVNYCDKMSSGAANQNDKEFYRRFWKSIDQMTNLLPESFLQNALFCGVPITVQNRSTSRGATLFTFCVIPDVHSSNLKPSDVVDWVPFSFFRCRQRTHKGSPDHAILARRNHAEFGSLLSSLRPVQTKSSPPESIRKGSIGSVGTPLSSKSWFRGYFSRKRRDPSTPGLSTDSCSEKGLVQRQSREDSSNLFGGIMVSRDITVDTAETKEAGIEMRDLGVSSEAGVADSEKPTYVDQLFRLTSDKWSKTSSEARLL